MTSPTTDGCFVVDRPDQPFVGTTRTVTMSTISEVADEIPRLLAWLGKRGRQPAGPPFLRYLVIDMSADMVVQAGVPVSEPFEGSDEGGDEGDVVPDLLPGGRYATTTHTGSFDGLYAATVRLLTWAGEEGLAFDQQPSDRGAVWAARVEWYETNPAEEPDPDRWVTRLTFRLAD